LLTTMAIGISVTTSSFLAKFPKAMKKKVPKIIGKAIVQKRIVRSPKVCFKR
jgi:hypothetical protein